MDDGEYLADWGCRGAGEVRTWYLVPSSKGGRLIRSRGLMEFRASVSRWASSAGVNLAATRVVSAVPSDGDAPRWPPELTVQDPVRDGQSVRFSFTVPYELDIFRGHFPTVPIVPGAVLVGWVVQLAREYCGWQFGVRHASALKFRRIVQPGLRYCLELDKSDSGTTLDFRMHLDGRPCANGSLKSAPHDAP